MAMLSNDIYIGSVSTPLYHFTNRSIGPEAPKGTFAVDTIGNELSINQFYIVIRYAPGVSSALLYAPVGKDGYKCVGNKLYALRQAPASDFMKELPYGTPVWWNVDGAFFAKGYLKSVDRIAQYSFRLTCISGVGLLDTKIHVGGLYAGETISSILGDIIGNTVTYSLANDVASVQVYGHLPYDTARNNLHRLLFSCGAALTKGDANTDYAIKFLDSTITQVPASRVAMGGRVDYQLPTNKVEITEHGFFQTANDETVVLYDNTNSTAAQDLTVIFENAPAYNLQTTGTLTIASSGVNHAVVNGVGTLTGKMYTHTQQIVTMSEMAVGDVERVKRVTNNELISSVNSRNVARRVLAYYKSAKTVKAKIMLDGEKCGTLLQLTDAFGDLTAAFLQRMDVLTTSVQGADCQLIEGYQPGNNGNNYLHCFFYGINSTSTWTVPAGVESIRVVLIGGGTGGQGGYNGEDGMGDDDMTWAYPPTGHETYTTYDMRGYDGNQVAAKGGSPGQPGSPGKVVVYDIDVTPGTVLTLFAGAGGAGGNRNGGAGSAGGASTLTGGGYNLSSANGVVTNGYYDAIGGNSYALPSEVGTWGGDGGLTDLVGLNAANGAQGRIGSSSGSYSGGTGSTARNIVRDFGIPEAVSGGGGGGGAYGAPGSNGIGTQYVAPHIEGGYWVNGVLKSGGGGAGGNAVQPNKPGYGCGGRGGHGGGGGGNAAGGYVLDRSGWTYVINLLIGAAGKGGQGSFGGQGGGGCIIIYY